MRISGSPRPPRRDSGFSLPEVLIATVVLSTIATVIAGVVSVVLRNTPTTEARAEDARSVMGLVTWLPQDVDSTPPTGFNLDPSTASGCGVDPAGSVNLLRLQWREDVNGTTTTFISNYRHVTEGAAAQVKRVTCSGTSSPPFATGEVQNVTSELPVLPGTWDPGEAPAAVTLTTDVDSGNIALVTFALTTFDGDLIKVDSAPKNPDETLPSTTLPSWYPPTPTTIVASNTLPTTTNLSFTAHPGVTTFANLIVNDDDGDTLAVAVDVATIPTGWTVLLSSLQMSIVPTAADEGMARTISYTVDDQQGEGVVTGTVTVEVVPTTTATTTTSPATTTTTTTTTLPACQVTSASASPSEVKNVQSDSHNQGGGSVNVGVLLTAVTVSATTNEYCSGLHIQYDSGGVNSPPFVNMVQNGSTSWSVTLPGRDDGSSETWSDGDHRIYFYDASSGPYTSIILTVK